MDVLVLQHIACEPPGAFEDVLSAAGADIHRVELDEGEPLPPWQDYVAIVAMGGPMSVNYYSEYASATTEKQAIADAVRAGVPYWGSCLGVQLLAASLAARVYAGPRPEVGVRPVMLTDEGDGRPGIHRVPRAHARARLRRQPVRRVRRERGADAGHRAADLRAVRRRPCRSRRAITASWRCAQRGR